MNPLRTLVAREFAAYFATPLALVFLLVFLVLAAALPFYMGGFYENEQADLQVFFAFHPWLYLLLLPALGMRLWSEERRSGSIELLMTLPVATGWLVLSKFLAAWLFAGLALLLTFPMLLTVNFLGSPDNGAILAGYLGSLLLAGAFLAVSACLSAVSKSPVVAFISALVVCFVCVVAGHGMVLDAFRGWAPQAWLDLLASMSFLTRFQAISRGVLDGRDLLFFVSFITCWLLANAVLLDLKKAD
ncbi:MAG: ABC transporter permease subunit [Thiopseudomonas sp.]|nr:ABC transporter permease subunit [Thiopseudomonas sp.]